MAPLHRLDQLEEMQGITAVSYTHLDVYKRQAMRKFVGIDFFEEDAPDATTLLKFRRLLEMSLIHI